MSPTELLTPYLLNLPHAIAARYARRGSAEYEELVSLGNYWLVKGAAKFDGGKGKLSTYLYVCVERQLKAAAVRSRTYTSKVNGKERKITRHEARWSKLKRLDHTRTVSDRSVASELTAPTEQTEIGNEWAEEVLERLPEPDRALIRRRFLLDEKFKDMAGADGTSQTSVKRKVDGAVAKLRRVLLPMV